METYKFWKDLRKFGINRYIYATRFMFTVVMEDFTASSKQAAEHYVEEYQRSYGLRLHAYCDMVRFMVHVQITGMVSGVLSKMHWRLVLSITKEVLNPCGNTFT